MFLVFDEGADYDYHVFTPLYMTETEEEAKKLVNLLEIERAKLAKFGSGYDKAKPADYGVRYDDAKRRKIFIKHNNGVKEICKVTPIEWGELYETGEYPLDMVNSYITRYHEIDYQEIPLYKKDV